MAWKVRTRKKQYHNNVVQVVLTRRLGMQSLVVKEIMVSSNEFNLKLEEALRDAELKALRLNQSHRRSNGSRKFRNRNRETS